MKECSKCGENKPLKDYHKSKKSKDGRRTECKKCREVKRTYKPRKDLRGSKFNKLFVLESEQPIRCETHGGYKWVCECECGNITIVRGKNLVTGSTKACGCLETPHGNARDGRVSSEYHSWVAMKSRCNNRKSKFYSYYGGRGITVCKRWDNFKNFLEDMGKKPKKTYTIDRIDYNGNYEPSNCRWASKTTQMRNQKINKRNKSGYKGVFLEKSGSWEASITINYKKIHLGRYKDKNDAIKARKKAEEKYFKHTD